MMIAIIVLYAIGILLIYSALQDKKPQDVIAQAFGGQ